MIFIKIELTQTDSRYIQSNHGNLVKPDDLSKKKRENRQLKQQKQSQ
jgi:hypothetical protein